MKPKIKRRRLVNAMMHGAARKSQNLHHMDDELRQEAPQLGSDYANVMMKLKIFKVLLVS